MRFRQAQPKILVCFTCVFANTHQASFKKILRTATAIIIRKLKYGHVGELPGLLPKGSLGPAAGQSVATVAFTGPHLLYTCGWLAVEQLYCQQVYSTLYKILLPQKPVIFHGRMVDRHGHHSRAVAEVSRGFRNLIVNTSFNRTAKSYNNLPAEIIETNNMKECKKLLKDRIQKTSTCEHSALSIISFFS